MVGGEVRRVGGKPQKLAVPGATEAHAAPGPCDRTYPARPSAQSRRPRPAVRSPRLLSTTPAHASPHNHTHIQNVQKRLHRHTKDQTQVLRPALPPRQDRGPVPPPRAPHRRAHPQKVTARPAQSPGPPVPLRPGPRRPLLPAPRRRAVPAPARRAPLPALLRDPADRPRRRALRAQRRAAHVSGADVGGRAAARARARGARGHGRGRRRRGQGGGVYGRPAQDGYGGDQERQQGRGRGDGALSGRWAVAAGGGLRGGGLCAAAGVFFAFCVFF